MFLGFLNITILKFTIAELMSALTAMATIVFLDLNGDQMKNLNRDLILMGQGNQVE
jgi:hypothetical protein